MTEVSEAVLVLEPEALTRRATDVAGLCKEIVLKTAVQIQGRKYVKAEGWLSIATAHGCIAGSKDVERVPGGYRAVGEIRRISDGTILCQAEGFVGEDEPTWFGGEQEVLDKTSRRRVKKVLPKRADYAIRGMCQTRAISRVCRAAFAHVVVMMDAGLSTTPAEEVPAGFDDADSHAHESQQSRQDAPGRPAGDSGGQNASRGAKASPEAKKKQDGASKPASAKAATEKTRAWMIEAIGAGQGQAGRDIANDYFREIGWLMPNEVVEDLPLRFVPTSKKQLDLLMKFGGAFAAGDKPQKPYEPNPEAEDLPKAAAKQATTQAGDWTQVQIPFGKSKGTKLGDLDKKVLFGWCQNFEVKAQYEKQGKTVDRPKGMIEKDKAFRAALDAAAKAMAKKGESE